MLNKQIFWSVILFAALFYLSHEPANAQHKSTNQTNTENITAVFHNKHVIKDNVITYDYQTILLQTFDEKGNLIREIHNTPGKSEIEKYRFFYYKNDRLVKAETYSSNDSLMEREEFEYNENNHLTRKITSRYGEAEVVIIAIYDLTPSGKPGRITGRSEKGKKLYTVKFGYDTKDRLIMEKWQSKIDFPAKKVQLYEAEIEEDEQGNITVIKSDVTYFSGETEHQTRKTEQEGKNTVWHLYYNSNQELIKKERNIYDENDEILRSTKYNGEENVTEHINYDRKKKSIHLGNVNHYLD